MNAVKKTAHSSDWEEHDIKSTTDKQRLWLLDYISKADVDTLLFLADIIKPHLGTLDQG